MKKLLFLFLAFLLSIPQAFATLGIPDSTTWVAAGWGGGGRFPMILVDNTTQNKAYLLSNVTSPFKTTDKGDNWTWMPNVGFSNDSPISIAQSPTNPGTLWIIGYQSINKSTDGGATWTNMGAYTIGFSGNGAKAIAIDRNNDSNVFVALNNGNIMKTTDAGANWTVFAQPFGPNIPAAFLYLSSNGLKLLAGSTNHNMIYYSTSDGTTPTTVTLTGTNSGYNTDYGTYSVSATEHLCVGAGLKIACTTDTSTFGSWTYTAAVTASTTYYISRFAVRRKADTSIRFVMHRRLTNSPYTTGDGVSDDGGATWTASITNHNNTSDNPTELWATSVGRDITSLAADPFDENVFYYTTDWRIMRTDDGGVNWYEKSHGAQGTVMSDITIAPNGRIFTCGMDIGCQYSDNNGTNWTAVIPSTATNQGYSKIGGHYWRVLTTGSLSDWNAGSGHVIVSFTIYQQPDYYGNAIARSVDNGATWTIIKDGFPKNYPAGNLLGLYGDTAWDHGYIRGLDKSLDEQTIYASIDGQNCQYDTTIPGNCTTNIVRGGIYKSTDNGATWAKTGVQPGSWKTYNGVAVDPTDATGKTMLFSNFAYNTYRTISGGDTPVSGSAWNYVQATAYGYDTRYDSVGVPYVVGNENSRAVIYKSIVTAFGNANGAYGTWQKMHTFNENSIGDGIVIDPLNNKRIFVSETLGTKLQGYRKVYVTTDAQHANTSSWVDVTGNMPAIGGCQALAVNYHEGAQGFLYCASNGGGILKLDLSDSPTLTPGVITIGG